jgi:hypothetical protein
LHFALTFFLCGLWLPVWILASVRIGGYRCADCGYAGSPLIRFGVPLLCVALFFGSCAIILPNLDLPEPREPPPWGPVGSGSATIPYRILDDTQAGNEKKVYNLEVDLVDGRLPEKTELGAVSQGLRSHRHKKTFVNFYLPGMEKGAGAFATAHHDPQMTVRILRIPPEYQHLAEGKTEQTPAGTDPTPPAETDATLAAETDATPPAETDPTPPAETAPAPPPEPVVPPPEVPLPENDFRVWTDVTGKYQVEATFESCISGTVRLRKRDGTTSNVPLERLSPQDQAWIHERGQ